MKKMKKENKAIKMINHQEIVQKMMKKAEKKMIIKDLQIEIMIKKQIKIVSKYDFILIIF